MKPQSDNFETDLIVRYLQGNTLPAENNIIRELIENSDSKKNEFESIKSLWELTGKLNYSLDSNLWDSWEKISEILNKEFEKTSEHILPIRKKTPFNSRIERSPFVMWIYRFAAVLLLGLTIYLLTDSYKKEPILEQEQEISFYEAITRKGERLTIKFTDGSTVYLNAGSKLIYPNFFESSSREVKLVGEAYFDIKSLPDKPFRVITGSIVNEVKGTEFNVKFRKEILEVVVTEGSVIMKNHKESLTLNKGDFGSFSEKEGFKNFKNADISHLLAWKNNKLSFKKTSLIEAMSQLELYFNVNVTFKNDHARYKKLTGYFDAESIDEVLENIELAMDISIIKEGRNVIIY